MTDNNASAANTASLADLVRSCFKAYEKKDLAMLETLLSDDFTFTSLYDNHIDKATYFERCWPFSSESPAYRFDHVMEQGNAVFVLYYCEIKSGKKFRNTELFTFETNKLKAVEVFFGNPLQE